MANMVQEALHVYILAALLVLVCSFNPISCSGPHSQHHHHELKSLHFVLYQHDTLNKTSFIIVNGVIGQGLSPTTAPFGTIAVLNDPLTVSPDPSSKVVGNAEIASATSSFDGLRSINFASITLRFKGHVGTISVVGVSHNVKTIDIPVVGGTGDFLFVQGYIRVSPVSFTGFTLVYKLEFHLYWPPYASKVSLA